MSNDHGLLLDAEAEHRASPRTYSVPRRIVRDSLKPGEYVKLLFRVDPPAHSVEVERMWVEIVSARDRRYTGRLLNEPGYLQSIKHGDEISFGPEHIAAIATKPGDALYVDPEAFAVVSRRVWDNDEWPRRLERHEIPDPNFSGWFVLAGDESADYKADMNNFLPVPQATLCDRYRVLDSGLEGPLGSTMDWDEDNLEYVQSDTDASHRRS
jgi:uncharacterized protein YegJ (DUF2314 family)